MASSHTQADSHLAEAQRVLSIAGYSAADETHAAAIVRTLELIGLARIALRLPESDDVRKDIRADYLVATQFTTASGRPVECGLADLSAGGAKVIVGSDLTLTAGERVSLDIPWLNKSAACEVRSAEPGCFHVQFLDLTEHEKAALEKKVEHELTGA